MQNVLHGVVERYLPGFRIKKVTPSLRAYSAGVCEGLETPEDHVITMPLYENRSRYLSLQSKQWR